MTLRNSTNTIIAQAITSAIDGVLAKSQHELRGLLRDFCESTARVFLQQQQQGTTQIFEEDGEDNVSESLEANRNLDQTQVYASEDPHDKVGDFAGMPIYDVYDDAFSPTVVHDYFREFHHESVVKPQEGDKSFRDKFLSSIVSHEIKHDMSKNSFLDGNTFTGDLWRYYDCTDKSIYDISDGKESVDFHYYIDPFFHEKETQGFNNDGDIQVVWDDAYIGVEKQYLNHGLGEKEDHRQFHHEPPDRGRHMEHTYVDLVATHTRITSGSKSTKLLEETRRLLKWDHEICVTELTLMEKHALVYKITFLMEALALETEKNKNLEYRLNVIHKNFFMLNKGSASLDMILSRGRTEKSIIGLGYQGDSSNSQTTFDRGKTAEQNNTRVDLTDEFSGLLECLDANGCLPTDNKFSMEPVYGIRKEDVRIQDESNGFDVQQRESIRFAIRL